MKFRDYLTEKEPKDVWKTGGQQVFTVNDEIILYSVKKQIITFKVKRNGKQVTTEIGLENNDPEKTIVDFLKRNI